MYPSVPGQAKEAGQLVMANTCRITASQLDEFLRRSLDKYKRALVEPGEVRQAFLFLLPPSAENIGIPGG